MADLNFPDSPNDGDEYSPAGATTIYTWNAAKGVWSARDDTSGGGGSSTFLGLNDTPADYTGEAGKSAVVNQAEDGLEFAAGGSGSTATYGPTFPVSPTVGEQHYLSAGVVGLYQYTDDGDSEQWVQTNGASTIEIAAGSLIIEQFIDPAGLNSWRKVGTILEQWGRSVIPGGTGDGVILFTQAYANLPTLAAVADVNAGSGRMVLVHSATTTQFNAQIKTAADTVTANPIDWYAIGEALVPAGGVIQPPTLIAAPTTFYDPNIGGGSYRIIGDTLECWGHFQTGSEATGNGIIAFPKTFEDANAVTAQVSILNAANVQSAQVLAVSTTELNAFSVDDVGAAVNAVVMWYVIGEWDGIS